MSFLKRLFAEPEHKTPMVRRRASRRPAPEFEIGYSFGDAMKFDPIRDISASGVYLLTETRWIPGSLVPLTLHPKACESAMPQQREITVPARAVRCGDDGVGWSFVPPEELDVDAWVNLVEGSLDQDSPNDLVGQFRMAEAVAFLSRITPSIGPGLRQLVRGERNNQHAANVVEIALETKRILSGREGYGALRAHEHVVLQVLEHGSWAEEGDIQRCWAGLLAASCMPEPSDESNLFLVDLFSQLAPIHIRIFTTTCRKATKVPAGNGTVTALPLEFSPDEMMKVSGSRDLIRIERDLFHLSLLGLMESEQKSAMLAVIDHARVTPTALGLQLYARCNGWGGSVAQFYGEPHPLAVMQ